MRSVSAMQNYQEDNLAAVLKETGLLHSREDFFSKFDVSEPKGPTIYYDLLTDLLCIDIVDTGLDGCSCCANPGCCCCIFAIGVMCTEGSCISSGCDCGIKCCCGDSCHC